MPSIPNPLITVFIPVFNGSYYLPETLESLKRQTFSAFEVVLIDDHSTDASLAVLNNQTADDNRFRVMQTPVNLGNAAKVLKYGLDFVKGEYFVYSSQDDLFSHDWLASMHARAVEMNADATIPDLIFYNPSLRENERALIGLRGNKDIILTGKDAFISSLDWTIPGNALWKTSIIRGVGWFDFGMNADEYSVRVFFLNCERVVFSGGIFYYRQNNPDAITKKLSIQSFDRPYTDLRLWLLAMEFNLDIKVQRFLINRSVDGLMNYTTLAYTRNLSTAIPKIKKTFEQYEVNNALPWLSRNKGNDFRARLSEVALRSYALFVIISLLQAVARRAIQWSKR